MAIPEITMADTVVTVMAATVALECMDPIVLDMGTMEATEDTEATALTPEAIAITMAVTLRTACLVQEAA